MMVTPHRSPSHPSWLATLHPARAAPRLFLVLTMWPLGDLSIPLPLLVLAQNMQRFQSPPSPITTVIPTPAS